MSILQILELCLEYRNLTFVFTHPCSFCVSHRILELLVYTALRTFDKLNYVVPSSNVGMMNELYWLLGVGQNMFPACLVFLFDIRG